MMALATLLWRMSRLSNVHFYRIPTTPSGLHKFATMRSSAAGSVLSKLLQSVNVRVAPILKKCLRRHQLTDYSFLRPK
jgi:hypothetical protein